jgi:YD repeat-containing protein
MSEDNRSSSTKARENFSRHHAIPREVDHNGNPIGKPLRYTYDTSGRLVSVEQEDDS